MTILLTGYQQTPKVYTTTNRFWDFLVILFIFVLVLAATALTTKWIADYQKKQGTGSNVELIETTSLGGNKYVQIVRIGKKYMAIAVGKDTITMLGEIPADQIKRVNDIQKRDFKGLLEKALKKESLGQDEPKE